MALWVTSTAAEEAGNWITLLATLMAKWVPLSSHVIDAAVKDILQELARFMWEERIKAPTGAETMKTLLDSEQEDMRLKLRVAGIRVDVLRGSRERNQRVGDDDENE